MKQKAELEKLKKENLEQYAIKGSESEWSGALSGKHSKKLISLKTGEKRSADGDGAAEIQQHTVQQHIKKKKKKKHH